MTKKYSGELLDAWMRLHRIDGAMLAKELGVTMSAVSQLRHAAKVTDALKIRIAAATLRIERNVGVVNPRGVIVADWLKALSAAKV